MDHHQFDEGILEKATQAILRTRDGKLRAAVPSPLGNCVFLNDVSMDEMYSALRKHKEIMKNYPRQGQGLEAFVDSSDTGYTMNDKPVETNGVNGLSDKLKKISVLNDDVDSNGVATNGANGVDKKSTNGVKKATKHASGPEGVDGLQNGVFNGTHASRNGLANGVTNGVNGHSNGVKVN